MTGCKIVFSGENSIEVQFEQKICIEVNRMVFEFAKLFEEAAVGISDAKIEEIVPTYCAVTVYFDCAENEDKGRKKILEAARRILDRVLSDGEKKTENSGRIVKIPVCYDDEEFAPDLKDVALNAGLSQKEVVRIHSSTDYLIYMLGFLPGFAYLGGLDPRLETPRLKTPRTKIQAGSVAIGGSQTGLYPVDSPGGWRIIGRTPLKVFCQFRNPAFLYSAGDKIRFVPVTRREFDEFDELDWLEKNGYLENKMSSPKKTARFVCGGGAKIIDGGLLTTVQDFGRKGFQKYGIGESGAMDKKSLALANALVKNDLNATCLETTLCGPELEFSSDCVFAITGTELNASLDGKTVAMNTAVRASAGSVLKCGFAVKGLRSYIAFSGGILVPPVFGSASTNVKSGMGGYGGKLVKGGQLAFGESLYDLKNSEFNSSSLNIENEKIEIKDDENSPLVLKVLPGAQYDFFDKKIIEKFTSTVYEVSSESDRMGIRFLGNSLDCGKTDIISDAIPLGAVQITSSGLPVVMAADRQTTGGYAKIATVLQRSMRELAQARPGKKVRFVFC